MTENKEETKMASFVQAEVIDSKCNIQHDLATGKYHILRITDGKRSQDFLTRESALDAYNFHDIRWTPS